MLRLKSLGQSVIEAGEARVMPAAETVFATALYLVMEAGRPVGRDELTRLLWPDVSDSQAQHGLRQAVYRLRSYGAKIGTERSSLLLSPEFCSTDFGELLAPQTPAALEALADQIGGSFLPAYRPQLSESFATWVDRQRDVVHSAVARTLMAGMQAKKRVSDWNGAERLALKCLAVDPLNEEATLTLAEAAALGGSKTKALSILNHYLAEIGEGAGEIKLPAVILRRRISEAYQDNVFPIRDAPFVGREEEMAELTRALARAQAGHGSAYVITGEPGIGKTRLLSEFTRVASLQRLHIVRVGCQSHDVRRPFSVFVDLVPKLLALPGALGCSPESMQFLRRLVTHDPDETRKRDQDEPSTTSYDSVRRAVVDILDATTGEGCVLLEMEDAQWLDPRSARLIEELSNSVICRQLVVVLTSRTSLVGCENVAVVLLRPLPGVARRVVAHALANQAIAARDSFIDWCVSSSGGNPYYLIELLRDGTPKTSGFQASASLTRLLQNRVQTLGAHARGLLEACCILGIYSTMDRIASSLLISRTDLLGGLQELDAAGMIDVDGPKVLCRHELLSSVVLSQMSDSVKLMLHRFAAEQLEAESEASQAVALIWESAEHWLRAFDAPRALLRLRRFGTYLIDVGLAEEASRVLERAQMLSTSPAEEYAIGADRMSALMCGEFFDAAIRVGERLILLRESIVPQPWTLDAIGLMQVQAVWHTGGSVRELAQEYTPSLSAPYVPCEEVIDAAAWLMSAADNLCDPGLGHDIYNRATGCLKSGDVRAETRLVFEMIYHSSFGDRQIAVERAESLAEHVQHKLSIETTKHLRFAAFVHQCHGKIQHAISLALEANSVAKRMKAESASASCALVLGAIYLHLGDLESAGTWLSKAEIVSAQTQNRILDSNTCSYLCELSLRSGDLSTAEGLLSRAVPILATAHTTRGDARKFALESQIAVRNGECVSNQRIEAFRTAFEKTKFACAQDFVAESLLLSLESAGRIDEARALAHEYTSNYRRDRSQMSYYLRDVIQKLGCAATSAHRLA